MARQNATTQKRAELQGEERVNAVKKVLIESLIRLVTRDDVLGTSS